RRQRHHHPPHRHKRRLRPTCPKQTGGRSRKRSVAWVITKGLWTVSSGEGPVQRFATSSATSRPPQPVTSRRTRPTAWSRPAETTSPCAEASADGTQGPTDDR